MEKLRNVAIKTAVRGLYFAVSSLDPGSDLRVLNYGFYDGKSIPLDTEDAPHSLRLALYHHVASAVDLSGKDVLEVGSGRGGGASYMARHLHPGSVHGVDLSSKAARFCQSFYDIPGLTFSQGDAENLELEDRSFDVVVNIESSHNYSNMERFVSEAHRVLRPGGYFLLADMRPVNKMDDLKDTLRRPGFRVILEEDITSNVLAALDRDNFLKRVYINRRIPRLFRRPFSTFAGIRGTRFYNQLQQGNWKYLNLVLQR